MRRVWGVVGVHLGEDRVPFHMWIVECAMALCCQEPHVLDDRGDNDDEEDYLM